ncbi:MAG TPA: GNAT family protein [Herpetosiphonaceae bacterium]
MNQPEASFPHDGAVLHWTTRQGTPLLIRHITAADAPLLVELYSRLSAETLWRRFGRVMTGVSPAKVREQAAELSDLDPHTADALVAILDEGGADRIIAVARLAGATDDTAEFALLVRDDFQGQGVGAFIFDLLIQVALVRGLRYLTAYVAAENAPMLALVRRSGLEYDMDTSHGETDVRIFLTLPFDGPAPAA